MCTFFSSYISKIETLRLKNPYLLHTFVESYLRTFTFPLLLKAADQHVCPMTTVESSWAWCKDYAKGLFQIRSFRLTCRSVSAPWPPHPAFCQWRRAEPFDERAGFVGTSTTVYQRRSGSRLQVRWQKEGSGQAQLSGDCAEQAQAEWVIVTSSLANNPTRVSPSVCSGEHSNFPNTHLSQAENSNQMVEPPGHARSHDIWQ